MLALFLSFLLAACALPLARAQKPLVTSLLPETNWQLAGTRPVALKDLASIGSQPAVEAEFGVSLVTQRTYVKSGNSITVLLEEAADPSSAYGLFTFYQTRRMHAVDGVQLAEAGLHTALMARGRYFIRAIWPASEVISHGDLRSLLVMIGGTKLTVENAEKLPDTLPSQGLVNGTERYLLGPEATERVLSGFPASLIGFQDGVEALLGTYISAGQPLQLLVVNYPTPQLAQIKYQNIQNNLLVNTDHGPGSVYGRLKGSYALLVLGAKSPAAADRLLDQFKLSQIVTWSPRYQPDSSEAYQLVNLVLANFELIGIIAVGAAVAGVMGVVVKRLIIKHFPESSFSKGQDNQLIRLKLS